jgi:hypothetical protein
LIFLTFKKFEKWFTNKRLIDQKSVHVSIEQRAQEKISKHWLHLRPGHVRISGSKTTGQKQRKGARPARFEGTVPPYTEA